MKYMEIIEYHSDQFCNQTDEQKYNFLTQCYDWPFDEQETIEMINNR